MIADASARLIAGRSAALASAVGVRSRAGANTAASGAGSRSRTTGRTSRTATGTTTLCPCRRHAEAQCQSESGNCDLLFHVLFLFEICPFNSTRWQRMAVRCVPRRASD